MSNANRSRELILDRIRGALAGSARPDEPLPAAAVAGMFESIADPLERLRAECAANRTELITVDAAGAAPALEAALSGGGGENLDGAVFIQDAPALRALAQAFSEPLRARLRWSSTAAPAGGDAAGLTLAEALVARTGSILISTACGGRTGSVLPPLHVVYATRGQLCAELEDALARLQQGGPQPPTSLISLITGPSRTSDIEKMLVMGAHGPRRVVVVLQLAD